MSKYSELKERMAAVEVLQFLKKDFSYQELVPVFELPVPVLSRYVNGHSLPGLDRARAIINLFERRFVRELLRRRVRFEDHVFDHSRVLGDSNLLDKLGKVVLKLFQGSTLHKVLTVEVDGIPVAAHVARVLGIAMVVAKSRKEMGVRDFVEVKRYYSSGAYSYLYIPKGSISRGERVLVVDDAVRTGSTLEAVFRLCEACGAQISGVFTLLSFRETLNRLRSSHQIPIYSILEM